MLVAVQEQSAQINNCVKLLLECFEKQNQTLQDGLNKIANSILESSKSDVKKERFDPAEEETVPFMAEEETVPFMVEETAPPMPKKEESDEESDDENPDREVRMIVLNCITKATINIVLMIFLFFFIG